MNRRPVATPLSQASTVPPSSSTTTSQPPSSSKTTTSQPVESDRRPAFKRSHRFRLEDVPMTSPGSDKSDQLKKAVRVTWWVRGESEWVKDEGAGPSSESDAISQADSLQSLIDRVCDMSLSDTPHVNRKGNAAGSKSHSTVRKAHTKQSQKDTAKQSVISDFFNSKKNKTSHDKRD